MAMSKINLDIFKELSNPYSGLIHDRKTVHISLSPAYIGKERKGVLDVINGWLQQYVKSLNGILLSFTNVAFEQRIGTIFSDQPFIHHDVVADFYVFRPQPGSILKGTVNKISRKHVSCLVHGCINVSLGLTSVADEKHIFDCIYLGQEILFQVDFVETKFRTMRVHGKLTDTCLETILAEVAPVTTVKKTNGYSAADDVPMYSEESENEVQHSDKEEHKKGMRKKIDQEFVQSGKGDDCAQDTSNETYPKKHKKKKKNKDVNLDEDYSLHMPSGSDKLSLNVQSEIDETSFILEGDSFLKSEVGLKVRKGKLKNTSISSENLTFSASSDLSSDQEMFITQTPKEKKKVLKSDTVSRNSIDSFLEGLNIKDTSTPLEAKSKRKKDKHKSYDVDMTNSKKKVKQERFSEDDRFDSGVSSVPSSLEKRDDSLSHRHKSKKNKKKQ